jgi:hypothetical protein
MLFLTFLLQVKNFYTLLIINLKLIWGLTWAAIQTFNPFFSVRASIKVQLSHNLRDFTFIWKIKNFSSSTTMTTPNLIKSNSPNSLQTSSIRPFLFGASFGGLSQIWKYLTRSAFLESANNIINRTFGLSFYYIQGFIFVLFIDACLTDDEPL